MSIVKALKAGFCNVFDHSFTSPVREVFSES